MPDPADAPPLRVVLADDHPVVRRGLRALLDTLPGIEVVGECGDGKSLLREVQVLDPDVAVVDVRMPLVDGLEATRRLRATCPRTQVLLLTMHDDEATVRTALRSGARGFLHKEAEQHEILGALRAVAAGQLVLGSRVSAHVVSDHDPERVEAVAPHPFPQLSDRERQVLGRLAAGESTSTVAAALFVSPKTVSNTLTSVYAKLGVADRLAAVLLARDAGLGRSSGDGA